MGLIANQCVLILGGSFDPVHHAHVAMAKHMVALLQPDQLRLIPAGQPWQKKTLGASATHRVNMLHLAFEAELTIPVHIDQQEIERANRGEASYTIDTLRHLRQELGQQVSLVCLLGADQVQNLASWKEWRALIDVANLCAVSRPGYSLDLAQLHPDVAQMWQQHMCSLHEIKNRPAGGCYWNQQLMLDISATALRQQLKHPNQQTGLASNEATPLFQTPAKVLDYIQQHHLYEYDSL